MLLFVLFLVGIGSYLWYIIYQRSQAEEERMMVVLCKLYQKYCLLSLSKSRKSILKLANDIWSKMCWGLCIVAITFLNGEVVRIMTNSCWKKTRLLKRKLILQWNVLFRGPIVMIDSIVYGPDRKNFTCSPSSREQEANIIRRYMHYTIFIFFRTRHLLQYSTCIICLILVL